MPLVIKKPYEQWDKEDLTYFHRQTCGPIQALNAYGGYQVLYMADHYQIKHGDQTIADDIPIEQLKTKIEEIVAQRRHNENLERISHNL